MMPEFIVCLTADGAAAVETLRAELARAKEQARISKADAEKAVGELKAEQAAHRLSKEKISNMALELRDAANKYALLERPDKKRLTLRRPYKRQRKPGRRPGRHGRRSGKLGRSRPVSPSCCELNSAIRSMPRLIECGVLRTHFLDLSKSAADAT